MTFSDYGIGEGFRPFVIAEMSGNHNGSLERALQIVDAAADAGAHAIKLQTYTADSLTLDIHEREFQISDPESPWSGHSLYELYQQAHTPWEWHVPIFERAQKKGLICFSSPFDNAAVDLLEDLGTPIYKIASFECVDIPLIRAVARTGKPMIISTGLATLAEIEEAIVAAREGGAADVMILKCTSAYPADPGESNLRTIANMRRTFDVGVGLSDHTPGIGAAVAAVAFGAIAVEKHLTLSRADGGVDAAFSMEPHELAQLVLETEAAWRALGTIHYGRTASEECSLVFRRSLYIAEDMRAGEVLTDRTLRSVRPGYGLPPKFLPQLIGKRVNRDVSRGTPMSWDLLA